MPLGPLPLQATRIMWYISTRGMAPRVDFEGALFSGYAPDGGLFMPEELPQLGIETLRHWSTLSYPSLVKELCALFIGPELIPRDVLNGEHPPASLLSHLIPLPVQPPTELRIRHLTPRRFLVLFLKRWRFPPDSRIPEMEISPKSLSIPPSISNGMNAMVICRECFSFSLFFKNLFKTRDFTNILRCLNVGIFPTCMYIKHLDPQITVLFP